MSPKSDTKQDQYLFIATKDESLFELSSSVQDMWFVNDWLKLNKHLPVRNETTTKLLRSVLEDLRTECLAALLIPSLIQTYFPFVIESVYYNVIITHEKLPEHLESIQRRVGKFLDDYEGWEYHLVRVNTKNRLEG